MDGGREARGKERGCNFQSSHMSGETPFRPFLDGLFTSFSPTRGIRRLQVFAVIAAFVFKTCHMAIVGQLISPVWVIANT
jgi:hypothetical protein